jgi:hypothetical protein
LRSKYSIPALFLFSGRQWGGSSVVGFIILPIQGGVHFAYENRKLEVGWERDKMKTINQNSHQGESGGWGFGEYEY